MWNPEEHMRVEVNGMGTGIIRKVMDGTVLVHIDKYNLEIELKQDAITPIVTSSTGTSSQSSKDKVIEEIEDLLGMTEETSNSRLGSPSDEVNAEDSYAVTPYVPSKSPVIEPQAPRMDSKMLQSRRTLESLRFGLVPHGHIEELTLGFSTLQRWVTTCFPGAREGRQSIHRIIGPFGTGKSHTMAVIRYLAAQRHYLTARVEVDGLHISLSDPQKLLNALCASLEGTQFQSETPILDLYEAAITQGSALYSAETIKLIKMKANLDTLSLLKRMGYIDKYDTTLEAVLSGSDEYTASYVNGLLAKEPNLFSSQLKLRAPISRSLVDRANDFIEGLITISHLAKAAGFSGLIVTIDEFEVESNLDRTRRERVMDLLDAIGQYMEGTNTKLPTAPLSLFVGTVGQESNEMDESVERIISASSGQTYTLSTWSREHRVDLARRIHELYQYSYGLTAPFSPKGAMEVEAILEKRGYDDSGLIRQFIKWYVALLDMLHGPPGS